MVCGPQTAPLAAYLDVTLLYYIKNGSKYREITDCASLFTAILQQIVQGRDLAKAVFVMDCREITHL
jgi:hypothetical protein